MENINVTGAGHQIIHTDYVTLMSQRAKGELPDMSCAIELIKIIKDKIIEKEENKSIKKLLDIGCATGHYYKTLKNHNLKINKYIGLEINKDMISSANKIWSDEINSGEVEFLFSDIEDQKPLPKNDLTICYNSFCYYKSAKYVLDKMLEASSNIIIRSYFADSNYRILRGQSSKNNDNVDIDEMNIFTNNGSLISADFWTIYSFSYIENLVKSIKPEAKISWINSKINNESLNEEKRLGVNKRSGTEIIGNYEISYPILQPWEILLIQL